jgi:hypothetical protein
VHHEIDLGGESTVKINERHTQPAGQCTTDRGLAGTSPTYESNHGGSPRGGRAQSSFTSFVRSSQT